MTNAERLRKMSVSEFAEWLTAQLFPEHKDNIHEFMFRYNIVRNFLMEEYKKEETTW